MSRTDYFASVLLAVVALSEIRARLRARKIGAVGVVADGRLSTATAPMFGPPPKGSGGFCSPEPPLDAA